MIFGAVILPLLVFPSLEGYKSGSAKAESDSTKVEKPTIEMVSIPAGTFTMGSPITEANRVDVETQHQVTLSAFEMSKYEITFNQYDAFCDATEREKPGDEGWGRGTRPVINVSWYDATAYCKWLSEQTGKTYRLPTEAEWEYACRAVASSASATSTPFNTGNNLTTNQANYDGNYPYNYNAKGEFRNQTLPVGSFAPNDFGLYDMHGNVWEWCSDWDGDYSTSAVTNPKGPSAGSFCMLRGGGWRGNARSSRSACRASVSPDESYNYIGFRIVRGEFETSAVEENGNDTVQELDNKIKIGDSYAGGIIFYIDNSGQHGLVCAASDQSLGQWGCYKTEIGGTSKSLGTGQANTSVIVNSCSEAGIAARLCNDLVLNGYDDWFLPSKDELNEMYVNLNLNGLGDFTSYWYWSSSECTLDFAWFQNFTDGNQIFNTKTFNMHVRAVRAF